MCIYFGTEGIAAKQESATLPAGQDNIVRYSIACTQQ